MTKILIATGNQGKFKEMMEVLHNLPLEFISLKDLGLENDAEETGETYIENAYIKADHFYKKTGIPTLAEDSGLEVTALKGELGVKTRRWGAGENATDEEWLDFFLKRMESEADRSTRFLCASAFISEDEKIHFVGESRGELTKKPQCEIPKGIPLSALFIPKGHEKVFAAMEQHEKNQISHRGEAMHQVKEFLRKKFM